MKDHEKPVYIEDREFHFASAILFGSVSCVPDHELDPGLTKNNTTCLLWQPWMPGESALHLFQLVDIFNAERIVKYNQMRIIFSLSFKQQLLCSSNLIQTYEKNLIGSLFAAVSMEQYPVDHRALCLEFNSPHHHHYFTDLHISPFFRGWSVGGSVKGVRGLVHKVVHGPGPQGGPWTGGQCFQVTRILIYQNLSIGLSITFLPEFFFENESPAQIPNVVVNVLKTFQVQIVHCNQLTVTLKEVVGWLG